MTEGENEVPEAWVCPRCGNADVDTLRLDDAEADEDRERVWCERCGLRYRLP